MGPWITLASYGCEELLKTQVSYMSVMITVLVTVLALLGLFIPIWNIDRMEKLKEKTAAEIDRLKEQILEQQENLENKIEEQRKDLEENIELNLQYRTIVLIKNNIISNMYLYCKNKLKKRTFYPLILISYILLYQIMTVSLELLKHDKVKYKTASIINICFNNINKFKRMIKIYEEINGDRSYKEIYDPFLGEYRDLFDPELIEFLEEVKRKEEEKSSAAEEE